MDETSRVETVQEGTRKYAVGWIGIPWNLGQGDPEATPECESKCEADGQLVRGQRHGEGLRDCRGNGEGEKLRQGREAGDGTAQSDGGVVEKANIGGEEECSDRYSSGGCDLSARAVKKMMEASRCHVRDD